MAIETTEQNNMVENTIFEELNDIYSGIHSLLIDIDHKYRIQASSKEIADTIIQTGNPTIRLYYFKEKEDEQQLFKILYSGNSVQFLFTLYQDNTFSQVRTSTYPETEFTQLMEETEQKAISKISGNEELDKIIKTIINTGNSDDISDMIDPMEFLYQIVLRKPNYQENYLLERYLLQILKDIKKKLEINKK
ncbi:hypothetical protein M1145_03580 [Patescibacteria group bacterium]|nr:hypothetical protein [Patescibacteria group bacterium]